MNERMLTLKCPNIENQFMNDREMRLEMKFLEITISFSNDSKRNFLTSLLFFINIPRGVLEMFQNSD